MSTVEYNYETNGLNVSPPTPPVKDNSRRLHRLYEVRQHQGMSLRSVSRRLNLTLQDVRDQEDPHFDLRISDLLKWQAVLEVPLVDLLVDSEGPLSEPVYNRASLLRIMKTAKAIQESAHECGVKRLANMLVGQLVQMMPELAEVSAWHTVGQRRTQDEVGRIVERPIPDSLFNDPSR
ncbi:MAG: hypothetical protein MI725_09335 [Pirellulales bacterium]|nr:hypothetical protein [Pirellulales bacterium]